MNTVLLLKLKAQLELAITEREAMVAENEQRKMLGQSMAYKDTDFARIMDELKSLITELQSLLNYGVHE